MPATLVDLAALWKILVAALLVGAGATALFGVAVRSAERLALARHARRSTATVALDAVVVVVTAAVCLALVVAGVLAMTHK